MLLMLKETVNFHNFQRFCVPNIDYKIPFFEGSILKSDKMGIGRKCGKISRSWRVKLFPRVKIDGGGNLQNLKGK